MSTKQHGPTAVEHLLAAEIDLFGVSVRAAKKQHRRRFARFGIDRMAKVTVVLFVAAAHGDHFDLGLVEFDRFSKVFL